jgi:DNA mismatch endonuclease, patch repair protein
MARVRSAGNTSTELRLISIFRTLKIIGWRRRFPLFGRPDFVFPRARVALFLDGDFWHGHPTRGRIPKSNVQFWIQKIARNKKRDRDVNRLLRSKGWRVIRIWEGDLSTMTIQRKVAPHLARVDSDHPVR